MCACVCVYIYIYIYIYIHTRSLIGQILVVLRSKACNGSHLIVGNKGSNPSMGRLFVSFVCLVMCR